MDSHPLNDSPGLRNGVSDGDHPNLSDRGLYNTNPNRHTSNGPGNSLPSNYLPHMDSHALGDSSGLRNGVSDGDHPNLSDRGLYNTDPNHLTSGSLPPLSHLNQQDHHHQSTYPPPDRSQHPQHGISRDPSNPTNPGSQALQNNAGGGIGPIRGSPATPVHRALPYSRLEGQRLTQDHVSTPSNRSSLSSVGSSHRRNSIQSSTSSDMLAVTIQTETFNSIRNIVKGLQDHGDNTKELTQIAQPLFQIPKEERWPAAVVLILTSFQELTGASQRSKPSSDVSGSEPLKAFISTTVRQLLLQPNLDQYSRGDSKTKKGPNVKTPYTLVKEALDAKDTQWLTQNLSIQWRGNPDDVERVDKLISAKLKADKNALAAIIKENLDSPDAVETLDQLVTQIHRINRICPSSSTAYHYSLGYQYQPVLPSMAPPASESDGNPTTQEKASTPPPTTRSNQTAPASVRRESAQRRMPIDRLGFLSTQNGTRRAPVDSVEDIFDNPVGSDVEERGDEDEPIEETQVVKTKSKGPVRTKGQLVVKQVSRESGKEVIIDVTQDSDDNNAPVAARKLKELLVDKDGFDHPRVYFFPAGKGPNQDGSSPAFACQWCPKEYLARNQSNFNLRIHRDGAVSKGNNRAPCPGRSKAISAGANLPPTATQLAEEAGKPEVAANSVIAYTKRGVLDNMTLNKLIVIWLVRHSLPWLRIEDFNLRVCFDYATSTSQLRSRIWVASHAHQLYLVLQERVIKEIKQSNSMVSLVSDVWTTKGSHKAFIGISCFYINQDFVLVTRHLAIKYVSWHHNGKYIASPFANILIKHGLHSQINSGSNNFTMANEMALIFLSGTGTEWNVKENHHWCICHVIALILGAGLKALNVSKKMVRPEKADKSFPSLTPILEVVEPGSEDEIVEVVDMSDEEEVDPDDATPDSIADGWEENNSYVYDDAEDSENSTGIAFTLKKIDYICRRIASSPQKQAEWKVWAAKISYSGRGVIGGYGIRWNIAYESRQRAYEGRRVIKQLIENKNERLAGKSARDHFFKSYELSSREWEDINTLNHILKRFTSATTRITVLVNSKFIEREALLESQKPPTPPPKPSQSDTNSNEHEPSDSDGEEFNFYPANPDAVENNTELERYNNGDFPMDKKGNLLGWWKASCNIIHPFQLKVTDARGKKIANDQHITKPAKARLAYLRFQIHLNNLLIIKNKGTKITTPGFWNQIDKDLAHRSCGTEAYQFAFSNLVLLKDAKVWDGKKGTSNVTAEEAALPTEDEIQAEMQRLNGIQP
ncbi:hypothetical protein KEM48_012771 [Puccinia striiformis f. sp. tritici PST-130]|nr:hypothetical protein KEM48_012771 [Puccinia striiformis f. sp. tritici PST-130]